MLKRILVPALDLERLIRENHRLKEELRYVRLNFHALFNIAEENIEGDDWMDRLESEAEINRAISRDNSRF